MGSFHVKLFQIQTSGLGGDVVERKSLRKTDKDQSQLLNLGELKTVILFVQSSII